MSELRVGDWVRIHKAGGHVYGPKGDRTTLVFSEGTIGVVQTIYPEKLVVSGYWYYADELTPVVSYEELEAQRDELLGACGKAEWGGFDVYGPMCPVCGGLMAEGHRDNCILKAAIVKARGEANHE